MAPQQRGDQQRRGQEAGGVQGERQGGRHHKQPGTNWWGDELVADQVGAEQAGVGPRQPIGRHDAGQQGDRGAVGQGFGGPEQQECRVQHRNRRDAAPYHQCQPRQQRASGQVDPHEQPPPLQPVDVGPGGQREQQPGQLLHEDGAGDQRRTIGEGGHQQRRGHPRGPVA